MVTDAEIRARVREKVARRLAVKDAMSKRVPGLARRWLRIESEEWRAARRTLHHRLGLRPMRSMHLSFPQVGLSLRRAFLTFGVVSVPVAALAWVQATSALEDLDRAMACAQSSVVFDHEGQVLGAIPQDQTADCQSTRAMLTAAFPPDATTRLARAITAIEGEYSAEHHWVWGGHDIRGLPRKLLSVVGVLKGRGLSSPMLTALEASLGEHDTSLWRKLVLAIATSRFAAAMDDDERATFITTHMGGTIGGGDPRSGLLAADAIFGRAPETTLEFCQMARASGQPLRLIRDEVTPDAARSWATINGPATALCIERTAIDSQDFAAAMAGLRAACGGTDLCLNPLGPPPGVPASMAARGIVDAMVDIAEEQMPRFTSLTPDESVRIATIDLARLSGTGLNEDLWTTIDAALQQELTPAIESGLEEIDRLLPVDVCLTGQCAHRVDHSVIVGEIADDGVVELRALFVNRPGAIAGSPELNVDGTGWHALPPHFGMASTGKAALAILAVEHGITHLCSNRDAGPECEDGEWILLREAVGHSLSEPHAWLAAQYPGELSALQDRLSLIGGETVVDASFDAAFGIGEAAMTPVNAMALFGAIIGNGQSGVRLFEDQIYAPVALTVTDTVLKGTRALLTAPLSLGGTLSAAGEALATLGAVDLVGKTGTHTESQIDLVLAETVGLTLSGRRFIVVVIFTATDPATGLGNLTHADLVPLQTAIVNKLR